MKGAVLVMVFFLTGCAQEADVIDTDGKQSTYCNYATWVSCVAKACPHGYNVIVERPVGEESIIKCRTE